MASTADNEVIVANGTVISTGMSEVRSDLCSHAMSRQHTRKRVLDLSLAHISYQSGRAVFH